MEGTEGGVAPDDRVAPGDRLVPGEQPAPRQRIAPVPREGGRQVIPRPPSARAGDPAPWAELPAGSRTGITVARVRQAMTGPRETPVWAQRVPADAFPEPGSPSAVLAAVFDEGGEARVVLTRRAAHLRSHRGEVSFPGGRLDGEETAEQGALREAAEEVGLEPGPVELVGRLSAVTTFASGSMITPVVGLLPARPHLVASPTEVEHVFDVALAELADPAIFREEWWTVAGRGPAVGGEPFPVWFFELPDDTVWGATARMLVDLLRLVLAV
jgi:8-oxo-dGTP pyrophosphatase MutT (NUDIX family)